MHKDLFKKFKTLDTFNKALIGVTLLFVILLFMSPKASGLVMMLAVFVFGGFSHYAKNNTEKIMLLIMLLLLALLNVGINGIRLGIDFKGGVRLPVTLSHSVDQNTMGEIVSKLKARISSSGMEQIVVKAIGNDRVFIEVPAGDEALSNRVMKIVTTQGIFKAVVDGKVVLQGRDVIPGTVHPISTAQLQGADWGIGFAITRDAAESFAQKVKGEAHMPVYMFLDKPYNSTVIIPANWIEEQAQNLSKMVYTNGSIDAVEVYSAMQKALEDDTGKVNLLLDTSSGVSNLTGSVITTKAIAENLSLYNNSNINLTIVSEEDLLPKLSFSPERKMVYPDDWKAVGLMSAPALSEQITNGRISLSYVISGSAPQDKKGVELTNYVKETERLLTSVLKGGAFPVKLYVGSKEVIPAPLGEKFLKYSIQGLAASILAVSIFIALRYMRLKLVIPIIVITLIEVFILISTIGSFTIDLSAMAGLIAAVGVSIDAQIIITDELLKGRSHKEAIEKAFEIINNNVILAVLVFFPLFFTHIVEVIGFAVTTIFSYILGALVSRPAYAALVEKVFRKEHTGEHKKEHAKE